MMSIHSRILHPVLCSGLAAGLVGSALAAPEVVELDAFTVTDSRPEAYTAASAESSSKLPVSLFANPLNIQVVPRSLLVDQSALRLEDVLKNVAGVVPGGYYSNWDYYRIRGFDADFNTFVDGLRRHSGMGEELFGLEQVEIVKGPASTLFGQGPLGGVVNLVSKRPQAMRAGELGFVAGSYGLREVTLDYNAPLDAGGTLLARLTALRRTEDSFIDYAGGRTTYVAPALTWKLAPDTAVTVLARYRERDDRHAMPLPAVGTILPNPNGPLDLGVFNGEPGRTNDVEEVTKSIGYEFVHRFDERFTLRHSLGYNEGDQTWGYILYPGYLDADLRTLYRYGYDYAQYWHTLSADTRLEAVLPLGATTHRLALGTDLYRENYGFESATIDFADPAGYTPIDLYNPVYGGALPALTSRSTGTTHGELWGFYLQDHITLGRGVAVALGGRYDSAKADGHTVEDFTPRAGLTWEFRRGYAFYANYSESFNPQGSWQATASGAPVDPETGTNYEVGLKTAAADGRLTATIALFQLTRQNVATSDPLNPGAFLVTGEQRSRGFEFDGRFSPVPGWELTLAYAYTDARITADNDLPVGARMPAVPYHTFNAWTKYVIQRGALANLGFGLGLRYYSDQLGDRTYVPGQAFDLPPYGLVDAALYYKWRHLVLQVNLNNVFDRVYYSGAYDRLYVLPGTPRTLRASATWKF